MTRHLKPAEIVDALEGTLDLTRRAHVDGCATCAREVESLRQVQRLAAGAVETHEPSPLFWTHLSQRVADTTRDLERTESQVSRSAGWLRPLLPVAAMAIVALMILNPRDGTAPAPPAPAAVVAEDDLVSPGDDTWDVVVGLASDLAPEQVREVAMPRPGAADALIDALTPEQREEFVRLLRAEMGSDE